jgi:prophage regulatory protein
VVKPRPVQSRPRRILRLPAVLEFSGLSETQIDEQVSRGDFPRPLKIGLRTVGWLESELEEWLNKKIAARDQSAA